jgi:hypothetical protein
VDLSGIIFVVLALAWALYLIPKAVKHHDEVTRTRSVDRFSTAMRVLARREPVDPRSARLVVTPPRSTERMVVPSRPSAQSEPEAGSEVAQARVPRSSVAARRAAARTAARRRRRVTLVLLGVDLVAVALAAVAVAPWWSAAVPAALTVLYLVLCRAQVRRENDAVWAPAAGTASASTPPRRAVRIDAAYGSDPLAASDADDDTVRIPVTDAEVVPVTVETADGGSLWDPLPVTLPTYVHKARAERTVRTIDLGEPGTWTSGRDEADSALVDEALAAQAVEESAEQEPWRAVGS